MQFFYLMFLLFFLPLKDNDIATSQNLRNTLNGTQYVNCLAKCLAHSK